MKLSVSVPDELWDKARRRFDDDSPSAVVQSALSRLVAAQAAPDYQVRPVSDAISAALEAARARVVGEAQEMFQTGYRQGAELVAGLGYSQLGYMAEVGGVAAARNMAHFAYEKLIRKNPEYQGEPLISPDLLVEYYGSYADYTSGELAGWTPSRPTTEGIDAALRDVWQRVTETVDLTGGQAEAAEQQ